MNLLKILYGRKRFKTFEEIQRKENMDKKRAKKEEEERVIREQNFSRILFLKREFEKGSSIEERINALIGLSEIKYQISRKEYFNRRNKKNRAFGICEVCKLSKSFFKHHMILLVNGGRNEKSNMIMICETCHGKIHPWLSVPRPKEIIEMDEAFKNTAGNYGVLFSAGEK